MVPEGVTILEILKKRKDDAVWDLEGKFSSVGDPTYAKSVVCIVLPGGICEAERIMIKSTMRIDNFIEANPTITVNNFENFFKRPEQPG